MTTYTCKCGNAFQSNSNSVTTGNRILRTKFTPDHDCFGCPFVKEANAEFLECRGTCNTPIYGTSASCVSSKSSTLHVSSLDFDFIQDMQDFYNSLGVENPKDPPYPGMENGSGRYQFSFDFPKNNKGEKAKRELIEHFFEPVQGEESYREMFARKDISGWAERTNLYQKISKAKEEAKAMAQGKDPVPAGKKYYHYNLIYYVDKRQDNGQYTVFMDDYQHPGPETVTPCATIPDFPTFEQAQNALDGYAIKREFTDEPTNSAETPLESDLSSNDTPADAAGEQEQDETPEFNNDDCPEEGNQDDSANDEYDIGPDGMEELAESQTPCDWQNASGADQDDEDEENDDQSEELSTEVTGDPLSLRGSEFDAIVTTADSVLNGLIAMLHAKKQRDGEMTIKITFEEDGYDQFVFGGALSGKINYTVKPQKISSEPVELKFDAHGNPIVPADRQHQLCFDELQPGREIKPSGTATVDGNTGIVENYQEDGKEPEDPPVGDDITDAVVGTDLEEDEKSEQQLPPCDHEDCPFHGAADNGCTGCCFGSEDPDDVNYAGDVWTAVNMEFCQRPEVLEAYQKNNPEDDYDGSDFPNEFMDLPMEIKENNKEDFAS